MFGRKTQDKMSSLGNCSGLLRASLFSGRSNVPSVCDTSLSGNTEGKLGIEDIDSAFEEIEKTLKQTSQAICNGLGHSFSATSVSTYVDDGLGRPKLFQASAATRTAPGGIRESRRASRNSESQTETLIISRHLGNRAYVEEKSRDCFSGCEVNQTELVNLEEDGLDDFFREWQASNQQRSIQDSKKIRCGASIPYNKEENVIEYTKDSNALNELL